MITVEDAKKLLDEAASEHGDMRGVRKLRDAAPDLARALLDARAELARVKADAAAAQALMVERAAEVCDDLAIGYAKHKGVPDALHDAARDIRALTPDAGTAELVRLRERAEKADGMVKRLARRIRNQRVRLRQMEGFKCRCCDFMAVRLQQLKRSNAYRADCDRLAAELAAAQQREAGLVERAEKAEQERDRIDQWRETAIVERDTYSEERDAAEGRVAALTEALGDMVGLFSADNVLRKGTHMNATLKLARAALAQTPTDPGDGWTWNERLGWIGPDGKPADPRRRG